MKQQQLLIATHNLGKVKEYRELLRQVPVELLSLDDLGITHDVEETGSTFRENAWLKAHAYSALGNMLTLSDDSGLEVDALGGAPGVHSARYGGDACRSDEERVTLLLSNLAGVPWAKRTARFRCFIAICQPAVNPAQERHPVHRYGAGIHQHPKEISVVGSVAGMIQYEPMGTEGFGYDPVFYLPSFGSTIAQLSMTEKNRISHRADATHRAVTALKRLLAET